MHLLACAPVDTIFAGSFMENRGQNNVAILTVRVAIISQRLHIEARLRAAQPVHVEHISVQNCLFIL